MPDVIDVIKGMEEVKRFIKRENLPAHSLKALLIMDDAIALLKLREPKPPIIRENSYGWKFYYCPSCEKEFYQNNKFSFCDKCGQAVRWDEKKSNH